MAKIVHLTSVHVALDNRIFRKECSAAVAAGHEVVLIAPHTRNEVRAGVRIRAVRPAHNRFMRMTVTVGAILKAALRERGALYQFHDPELIPVGLMLRLMGRRVIYDVHEDNVKSIALKEYVPVPFRRILASLMKLTELVACRYFDLVLAEKSYQRRFPRGTLVLNYPVVREYENIAAPMGADNPPRVLYTGGVSTVRGALNHVQLLHEVSDIQVFMVGRCTLEMADELRRRAGRHGNRLHIVGEGRFVPFEEIMEYYARGGWLAGLALFPRTPHYEDKELTKFFEYMAAGIPVLCSDFPVWRCLIEDNRVGMCVNAERPEPVAEAIGYLKSNSDAVNAMQLRARAVARRFSWDTEADRLLELYDRNLGRPAGVTGPYSSLYR